MKTGVQPNAGNKIRSSILDIVKLEMSELSSRNWIYKSGINKKNYMRPKMWQKSPGPQGMLDCLALGQVDQKKNPK